MEYKKLIKINIEKLEELRAEKQTELTSLQFKLVNSSLKDTSQLAKVRKDISQIKTAIKQKETVSDDDN
ncbi:50S ribosomal protein L29 [bacterium]|jgi:ribosomal protein L29|nr:50S ribosomal protein L29 [bacterium]